MRRRGRGREHGAMIRSVTVTRCGSSARRSEMGGWILHFGQPLSRTFISVCKYDHHVCFSQPCRATAAQLCLRMLFDDPSAHLVLWKTGGFDHDGDSIFSSTRAPNVYKPYTLTGAHKTSQLSFPPQWSRLTLRNRRFPTHSMQQLCPL